MPDKKVWFITGSSRGFGRVWAEAALRRGDKVVATARDVSTLQPLVDSFGDAVLPLRLDVTERASAFAAIARGHGHFGRLDIVLNNAGYGHCGAIEEISEADARQQIETNLFGTLWVTQAALPILRAQHSGHILAVSSIGGVTTFPALGMYHVSKWGLEGLMETLSQEAASFGIKVTIIEPGGYATDFVDPRSMRMSAMNQAYDALRGGVMAAFGDMEVGDPAATADAILKVVNADAPPLRIALGTTALPVIRPAYAARMAEWDAWEAVTVGAQGTSKKIDLARLLGQQA
jgi:NAD(P)-dependent dehydrogenase (short-subunit alcohol dehydrogenase family)